MLDTGAGPSSLKFSKKPVHSEIAFREIIELSGITDQAACTMGRITLYCFNLEFVFHLVPDSFPMLEDGLLGSDCFRELQAKIDYAKGKFIVGGYQIPIINCDWNVCSYAKRINTGAAAEMREDKQGNRKITMNQGSSALSSRDGATVPTVDRASPLLTFPKVTSKPYQTKVKSSYFQSTSNRLQAQNSEGRYSSQRKGEPNPDQYIATMIQDSVHWDRPYEQVTGSSKLMEA
ncbi:hypothetical protein QAD02_007660 [Eretmocerus hayati]|uniref:Uncharacterized protein n=1 Tax=Eretmocerus hayati TaxID=131215 RepID=A0ACC2N4Y8_9HYME|nr:hypothetical protein QAD02_007660 [Eretmocerus hayati]